MIKDLEQVSWKATPQGKTLNSIDDSDGQRTHLSDALGYLLWRESNLRGEVTFGSEAIV